MDTFAPKFASISFYGFSPAIHKNTGVLLLGENHRKSNRMYSNKYAQYMLSFNCHVVQYHMTWIGATQKVR